MLAKLFETHGRFCVSYPLEIIVTTLTLTACMLNLDTGNSVSKDERLPGTSNCWNGRCNSDDHNAVDLIVMTIIRCLAILFSYHQFRNLYKLGSKWILGVAILFIVFSSVIFTTSVVNFSRSDASDLKDALFFFLLLIDLNKAGVLAQLALSSRSQEEVRTNIARGMSLLGPTITLDTLVEILLIGIGLLSGVKRLEILCSFACLGIVVNYIVFMTLYPACLSLILELSRSNIGVGTLSADTILMLHSLNEEDQKPNPVVERVKLIMIAGLFVVHAHSRWPFKHSDDDNPVEVTSLPINSHVVITNHNKSKTPDDLTEHFMNWLSISADNIVILILLLALALKFIFIEDKGDIAKQLQFKEEEETLPETQSLDESTDTMHATSLDVSLRHRFGNNLPSIHTSVFPLTEMNDNWIEVGNENHIELEDKEVQTDVKVYNNTDQANNELSSYLEEPEPRSVEECLAIYRSELGASGLTDREVIQLVQHNYILPYQLEKAVDDMERGVGIRRLLIAAAAKYNDELVDLPYFNYDYSKVLGACCENVIGYTPVPVGFAGPLLIDGELFYIPMATTEGCLVASTNRGCRAISKCGITTRVVGDGMTRAPAVKFPGIVRASEAMAWIENPDNFPEIKRAFDGTSNYAKLTKIDVHIAGRYLFIRFVATTGDAMGMNMLSKGTEKALEYIKDYYFTDMEILSLSGNVCADKKPAAINWIKGRGKSVVCEAVIPGDIVTTVLKTSVDSLVEMNPIKNLVGSAVAGSIGGFNAHAANVVTAIFIATGQDPAQNVGSSNCMTLMEPWGEDKKDLYISCTMPSIEVGTVGGGTGLPAQSSCLAMLGVKGAHKEKPGTNANKLARIVCATVLAGELSLMSALTAGHLVKSHLRHNRSSTAVCNPVKSIGNEKLSLPVPNQLSTPQFERTNNAS